VTVPRHVRGTAHGSRLARTPGLVTFPSKWEPHASSCVKKFVSGFSPTATTMPDLGSQIQSMTVLPTWKGRTITSLPAKSNALTSGERRRWYVHLALLVSLAGSLLSLIYLSKSITMHVIFGVWFMAMLLFHFYQRRRTIASLLKRLLGVQTRTRAATRLVVSDIILDLLVLDVLVSGIIDCLNHQATAFPFASALGLPPGLSQWHKLAALVLVVYAVVHVIRRRKRLRRSHIQ